MELRVGVICPKDLDEFHLVGERCIAIKCPFWDFANTNGLTINCNYMPGEDWNSYCDRRGYNDDYDEPEMSFGDAADYLYYMSKD